MKTKSIHLLSDRNVNYAIQIYLILCLVTVAAIKSKGQNIPNSGFEMGTGDSISRWTTLYDVKRVTQYHRNDTTINPFDGTYFLQVTTRDFVVPGDPSIKIGSASIMFPCSSAPDSIVFHSVYFPVIPEDGFIINVDFRKFDTTTHMSSLVQGNGFSGTISQTWKRTAYNFFYFGGKPELDTIVLTIKSTNPGQHNPNTGAPLYGNGAVLLIDNVNLLYKNTGINEIRGQLNQQVFPNPFLQSNLDPLHTK